MIMVKKGDISRETHTHARTQACACVHSYGILSMLCTHESEGNL